MAGSAGCHAAVTLPYSVMHLLRYDLFRLTRTRMVWVYLVALLLVAYSWGNGVGQGQPGHGGFLVALSFIVSMLTAHRFACDYAAGFMKNVLQAPRARVAYVLAAFAGTLVATVAFTLLGYAALLFGACVRIVGPPGAAWGFDVSAGQLGSLALPSTWSWLLEVVMVVYVHACLALVVSLVTGSKVLGVFAGMVTGWGFSELGLLVVLQGLRARPVINWLEDQGAFLFQNPFFNDGEAVWGAFPIAMSAVLVASSVALSIAVMRRRDVSGHAE